MRLAFMGTPDFATYTLQALIDAGHEIAAVYTQPPAKAGRGKKIKRSPVHILAESYAIPVKTPSSMRDSAVIEDLQQLNLDMAVVVAYGQILPQPVLDTPRYGCVNVHASLLPRWRGAAPIHRAIMAGDFETGVGIMVMEAGLDTGPVILEEKIAITHIETTLSLHDTLAKIGAGLIHKAITGYVDGTLHASPQQSEGVTYAKKIDKAEAKIDWSQPATEIHQKIRGLYPFPGAWFEIKGTRIKVLDCSIIDKTDHSGLFLDDDFTISCGKQALKIHKAQRAGKGPMTTEEFLRGFPLPKGTKVDP